MHGEDSGKQISSPFMRNHLGRTLSNRVGNPGRKRLWRPFD
jgi:hypothetical protein